MSTVRRLGLAALLLALLGAPALAALELPVRRFVLPNGLTVLFLERRDAPVFAAYLLAKVGSVNEAPGITGGSHLLEHMMFKGSRRFGTTDYAAEKPILARIDRLAGAMRAEQAKLRSAYTGGSPQRVAELRKEIARLEEQLKKYAVSQEIWGLYQRNGGSGLNASTGWDSTQYFVQLPANRFRLWALLESDRLADPVFRDFYSERDVVREERRTRTDTNPGGLLFEQFMAAVHTGSPYRDPIVGWPSDLETMQRSDMLAYFRRYYAPNNLVVVLVGDLREAEVRQEMAEHFGRIPRQPEPPPVFTQDTPPVGERRIEVVHEAKPQLLIGYPGPPAGHPDQYALEVLGAVLSMGRTSRLHRSIVEPGLAVSASAGMFNRALGNLFLLSAVPQAPHASSEVEVALERELRRLVEEPVEAWELDKVRNNLEADFIRSLDSPMGVAAVLAQAEAFQGTWRNFDERERYAAVTAADVQRVAREYLARERRTVATLVEKEASR